jgi:predicted metal-dependent hydrolase
LESIDYAGYTFHIRRAPRRRRLSLNVKPDGSIQVLANNTLNKKTIISFISQQLDWVEQTSRRMLELRQTHPQRQFRTGEFFPYAGKNYQLVIAQGAPQIRICADQIFFYAPTGESRWSELQRQKYFMLFKQAYKKAARQLLLMRVEHWSQVMGLKPSGLGFRMQKTLWGSCSPTNRISLNMKLVVAPLEVIDYVVIHELAHIKYKNHSKVFWSLVEEYTSHRHLAGSWLKENLFASDFLSGQSELHPPQ